MKASLKLRDERTLLVRAKLPLNVLGLPLFTGITSGDPQELALHVGTQFQAGPTLRLSYKPNDAFSPFCVLVKTGFGLWGSSSGTPLAMSAEFDLNSMGASSFSLKLKPKLGDFGFQRYIRSFRTFYNVENSADDLAAAPGQKTKSSAANVAVNGLESGLDSFRPQGQPILLNRNVSGPVVLEEPVVLDQNGSSPILQCEPTVLSRNGSIANGDLHVGISPTASGSFAKEKLKNVSSGILEKASSFELDEKPGMTTEQMKEVSENGAADDDSCLALYHHGDTNSDDDIATSEVLTTTRPYKSKSKPRMFWAEASGAKGWNINVHSSLPVGRRALAKVRWQVKFDSNPFHNIRHGLNISDIKLPVLSVDKFSFEAVRPSRDLRSTGLDFEDRLTGYSDCDGGEGSPLLGRIVSMCTSMRYQLHQLQSENKVLMSSIDKLKGEALMRRPAARGTELMTQEENTLRSQMFDELTSKKNGPGNRRKAGEDNSSKGNSSKGDFQSGSNAEKTMSSIGAGSAISMDDPAEELKAAIMSATRSSGKSP